MHHLGNFRSWQVLAIGGDADVLQAEGTEMGKVQSWQNAGSVGKTTAHPASGGDTRTSSAPAAVEKLEDV